MQKLAIGQSNNIPRRLSSTTEKKATPAMEPQQDALPMPKTVLGEDGVLRSDKELDLSSLPTLEGTSFIRFLLDKAERQVNEKGDRIFLTNADLSESWTVPLITSRLQLLTNSSWRLLYLY